MSKSLLLRTEMIFIAQIILLLTPSQRPQCERKWKCLSSARYPFCYTLHATAFCSKLDRIFRKAAASKEFLWKLIKMYFYKWNVIERSIFLGTDNIPVQNTLLLEVIHYLRLETQLVRAPMRPTLIATITAFSFPRRL